jgi:hypothetical protein
VQDFRSLAVDNLGGAHDASAKNLADGLVTETNTQDRNASSETRYQRERYARVGRAARARRDQNAAWEICLNVIERYLVVPSHHNLLAKLAQVLDQVVSKRIVVIDDQDHFLAAD